MIIFMDCIQRLLLCRQVIAEHKAGYVCRYTYVGAQEGKIFLGVDPFYQEKKRPAISCMILAP